MLTLRLRVSDEKTEHWLRRLSGRSADNPDPSNHRRERILRQLLEPGLITESSGHSITPPTYLDPSAEARGSSILTKGTTGGERELSVLAGLPSPPRSFDPGEHDLLYRALHDTLTGLCNRPAFEQWMRKTLAYARRYERKVAVLFVDLDGFKKVNDAYGHQVGDMVLVEVARRLSAALRESDLIARWGGDEFVAGLPDIVDKEAAHRVADKLCQQLERPITVQGYELRVSASVGVSVFPEDGEELGALIHEADLSMYRTKRGQTRSNLAEGVPRLETSAKPWLVASQVKHALDRGEFTLYFQPLFSLSTGQLHSVEALLRWQHPRLGLLRPSSFLPAISGTPVISAVTGFVLKTASEAAVQMQRALGHRVPVAVNMTESEIRIPALESTIAGALNAAGLDPSSLLVELPESAIFQAEGLVRALERVQKLGVGLVVDDFGKHAVRPELLRNLSAVGLKIAGELIAEIHANPRSRLLVHSLLALAKSEGLQTCAEQLEKPEQLIVLEEAGCEAAQGYLLGMPMPLTELLTTGFMKTGVQVPRSRSRG